MLNLQSFNRLNIQTRASLLTQYDTQRQENVTVYIVTMFYSYNGQLR